MDSAGLTKTLSDNPVLGIIAGILGGYSVSLMRTPDVTSSQHTGNFSNGLPNNSGFNESPYAGLLGVAIATALVTGAWQLGHYLFWSRFLSTIEVTRRDANWDILLVWLSKHGITKARHVSLMSKKEIDKETGRMETVPEYYPSVGTHELVFKGHWIKVQRWRQMDRLFGYPFETLVLTTYGDKRAVFEEILQEARNAFRKEQKEKLNIYLYRDNYWERLGLSRIKRPLSTVILDEGVADEVYNDLKDFLSNYKWYTARGVPYRRGYLFHGPPGCGKSSLIAALASEFDYSISVLTLSDKNLTDDALVLRLGEIRPNSFILLEDIDAAFESRIKQQDKEEDVDEVDEKKDKKPENSERTGNRLTFSGLLNAIDGICSADSQILFMTTNHVDRLDPALIRPGRVDVKKYIGHCSESQLKKMYRKMYQEASVGKDAEEFAREILNTKGSVSPASVQGLLMHFKSDSKGLLKSLREKTTAI